MPRSTLIQRLRTVVIDDSPDDFPFEILRSQGYAIDHWLDVQDIGKLEDGFYDIIVLDIGGIGRTISPQDGGIGSIRAYQKTESISDRYSVQWPVLCIRCYRFFRMADDYLPKPASALTWKDKLDSIIDNKISAAHYWGAIAGMLRANGAKQSDIDSAESQLATLIEHGETNPHIAGATLLKFFDNTTTVLGILAKLMKLFAA